MFAVSPRVASSAPCGDCADLNKITTKGAPRKWRCIIMYVRFVTPLIHPHARAECGFFHAAWYLRQTGCPDWIHSELEGQFTWFNENLSVPRQVVRDLGRRGRLHGICWFRDTAQEHIEHARYCAWLITEGGLPVDAIKLRRTRVVFWEDGHQVVTPSRNAPRAFHGRPIEIEAWGG